MRRDYGRLADDGMRWERKCESMELMKCVKLPPVVKA